MKLENTLIKLKESALFLEWYKKQLIHTNEGIRNPKIENVHWDIAKYYTKTKVINIKKKRNVGMSTFNISYAVWTALQKPGINIAYIVHHIKYFIYLFKSFIPSEDYSICNDVIIMKNGSKIYLKLGDWFGGTGHGFYGMSYDLVVIDEFLFYKNSTNLFNSFIRCVKNDNKIIICSSLSSGKCFSSNADKFENLCDQFGSFSLYSGLK